MQLSKKMLKISPSGTVILAQKARQLKAEGKDIIDIADAHLCEDDIYLLQRCNHCSSQERL